jgi:Ohr subfamily peroxiredoxin
MSNGTISKILYTATATAKGGREGHIKSSDGVLDFDLKVPKELGGPGGAGSNPEQLFAAGYAACFEGAVRYVARERKIALKDASVTAQVGIGPREPTGFGIAVKLEVSLPGIDRDVAQQLVDTAHSDICPYSHATRGNVDVQITLA